MTMEPYVAVDDSALVNMLLDDGDLTKDAALALISHVRRSMDSAYRSIIVLVYGRAWIALGMSGPLEMLDMILNGRALKLNHAERIKIIRLLDTTGLTREQIAHAVGLDIAATRSERPSKKGPVPARIPKRIAPKLTPGATRETWLRPTTVPFTTVERRRIERRLDQVLTPTSRANMVRSVTAAAGHLASAVGVRQHDAVVAQLLLQAASLKGILMDEALEACYLPDGQASTPARELRAIDALSRWYVAWVAANRRE